MVRLKALLILLFALIAGPAFGQACGTVPTCPPFISPLTGNELFFMYQNGVTTKISLNQMLTGIGSGVTSFNGRSGIVVPATNDYSFSQISGTASAAQGGTGINGSAAGNGTLLIGNGSGYTLATLTAGTNISIANSSGGITISQTGSAALIVGTTVISGGTSGRIEYNNGGVLGELTTTGSGSVVLNTSPSISALTVTTSLVATGLVTTSDLASQIGNSIIANASASSASPSAVSVPSCSAASDALIWTPGSGPGCNSSITANSVPAANLTGTTLASNVVTSSLTTVGTIGTGTWQGTIVAPAYGGTGVNNGSSTLTLGANLTTTGSGAPTLAFSSSSFTYTYPSATSTLAALSVAQTWSAAQTFNANELVLGGVTGSTQCLHASSAGVVTGTGSDCGSGGGTPGGSNTDIQYNNSGSFGGNAGLTYDGSSTVELTSASTNAALFELSNTSSGGHLYGFFSSGSANAYGAGVFGVYDYTSNTGFSYAGANSTFGLPSAGVYGFTANAFGEPPADTGLSRDAADAIDVGNGSQGNKSGTLKLTTIDAGVSGTSAGTIVFSNATSGSITLTPTTGALGIVTATLPANTGTLAELNLAQTWSAAQTFDNADLILAGSSSGSTTLEASAAAGGTATLPDNTGIIAELNLAQTWSAVQTFNADDLVLGGVTGSTQCLQASSAGVVTGTGSTCGSGGSTSPGGSNTDVQYNNSSSFGGNAGFTYDGTSKITLGVSGTSVGSVAFNNATSGSITLSPATGALGSVTATLPANTGTIAELNLAQTWSAAQTFDNADLLLAGSTSGTTTLEASATASGVATFPAATDTVVELTQTQTLTNKTISGSSNTLSNIALSSLATESANTVVGNGTGSTASPTALPAPSCSATGDALNWTSGTGFGCNTAVGSVTSVGLADNSSTPIYTTGSPVTSSGNLTFTLATETANFVFAGPTSGAAAQPTFRAEVFNDQPKFARAMEATVAMNNFGGI